VPLQVGHLRAVDEDVLAGLGGHFLELDLHNRHGVLMLDNLPAAIMCARVCQVYTNACMYACLRGQQNTTMWAKKVVIGIR